MNPKMLLGIVKMAIAKLLLKGVVEISKSDIGGFWIAGTLIMADPGDTISYVQIDISNETSKIVLTTKKGSLTRFGKGTTIGVIEPTGV